MQVELFSGHTHTHMHVCINKCNTSVCSLATFCCRHFLTLCRRSKINKMRRPTKSVYAEKICMYVYHLKFAANTNVSKAITAQYAEFIFISISFIFKICFLLSTDGRKNATLELFHKQSQLSIRYARARHRTNTFNFRNKKVAVLLIAKKLNFHNVKNTLQAVQLCVCVSSVEIISGNYFNCLRTFAGVVNQEQMQIFVY